MKPSIESYGLPITILAQALLVRARLGKLGRLLIVAKISGILDDREKHCICSFINNWGLLREVPKRDSKYLDSTS